MYHGNLILSKPLEKKQKISYCVLESELPWEFTSKQGGTEMIALKRLSLTMLNKG